MEDAIPCGIRVYTDTELWTNTLSANRGGCCPGSADQKGGRCL